MPPRSALPPATGPLAGAPGPWTWLEQVHGADVVVVRRPGEHAGARADAAVTQAPGCTVAVRTADCAPVVLLGAATVAVAHLGWRGLAADLVQATAGAMADLGDPPRRAVLGPCVHPGCYEFGDDDLEVLAARFGPVVRGRTTAGTPALDVPATVRAALAEVGVVDLDDAGACTSCGDGWFSHRARADAGRFATAAWIEA